MFSIQRTDNTPSMICTYRILYVADRVARYQAINSGHLPRLAAPRTAAAALNVVFYIPPWFLVLLALFPFVLVLMKRSSVVGVASLLVYFCRSSLFLLCFPSYLYLCFVCLFVLFFVVLPVASPQGEDTRQRTDGRARQWFFCRPGEKNLPTVRVFFFFFSSLFVWFFFLGVLRQR